MKYDDTAGRPGLLHALTRNFADFLFDASDEDGEPTPDSYRGFRDPDEQLRPDRWSDWHSSGRSATSI